jgi:hypothetical protein
LDTIFISRSHVRLSGLHTTLAKLGLREFGTTGEPGWRVGHKRKLGTANLGDRRLNLRLGKLLEQVGGHPQWSLPAACGGWAELQAAYRFFDNEKVTFQQVLAPHRDASLERMAACPVVRLVQDTTENDERLSLGPKGLGTLPMEEKHARRLHPTVAFTPDRICLGVVQAAWWERGEPRPRRERRYKGVDEKESYRWLASYQESCALQGQLSTPRLVNLAEAEGDLYEWFQEHDACAPEVRADWIVRAAQDRRLRDAHDGTAKRWETLPQAPALGTVDVGATTAEPAREDGRCDAALGHRTVGPARPSRLPLGAGTGQRGAGPRGRPAPGRSAAGMAAVDQSARGWL